MAPIGIKILLPTGDPNGIKVVEISGWEGQAFIIPRGKLKEVKDREEAGHPAIYFLFGEGEESTREKVYIGESESFYSRLLNHNDNKDFWNTAVVFTGGVNRAHVKFLENKSVSLAKKIDRYDIVNQVEPLENRLKDFEKAEANDFFEKIKLILGVSGLSLFQDIPNASEAKEIYFCRGVAADAQGTLLESGEFIVYKGSLARITQVPSFSGSGPTRVSHLLDEGVLKKENDVSYIFTRDYIFTSPSAASDTVKARSSNGWTNWVDSHGKTLDENLRK